MTIKECFLDKIGQLPKEVETKVLIEQYLVALGDEIAPGQGVRKFESNNGMIAFSIEYNKKLRNAIIKETVHYEKDWVSAGGGGRGGWAGNETAHYKYERGFRLTKDILGIVLEDRGDLFIWNKRYIGNANSSESIDNKNPILWQSLFRESPTALGRINEVRMMQNLVTEEREKDRRKWVKNPTRENRPHWRSMPEMSVMDYIDATSNPSRETSYIEKTKGDLRRVVKIEGVNSPEGFQQFAGALTEFYAGLKTGQGK